MLPIIRCQDETAESFNRPNAIEARLLELRARRNARVLTRLLEQVRKAPDPHPKWRAFKQWVHDNVW